MTATIPKFASLDEAHAFRLELLDKLERIEGHLADTNKTDAAGARMSFTEYADWKRRALAAKRHTVGQLRLIKDFIRKKEQDNIKSLLTLEGIDVNDPEDLIRAAAVLLSRLLQEEVEFDDQERQLIYALKDRVKSREKE